MKTEKLEVIREYFDNGQWLYSEQYYLDGKLHNPHGPAIRSWYENGQLESETYFLNGKRLTKEAFEARNKPSCNGKIVEIDGKKYKLTEI